MKKENDSVLVLGSGPIRIGQGCEFDYSCTQACRALKQEGLRVILVNPNPATIMTDPETADAVYIEPLNVDAVTEIIAAEKPTWVLATMGGQDGLNLALELEKQGVFALHNCHLLGITTRTIEIAEDREKFKELLREQGLGAINGCVVHSSDLEKLDELTAGMRFPLIIRASFTLGGAGGCIVEKPEELRNKITEGLQASGGRAVTIEESIVGWKEYELEVMTDDKGTFVVVAAVENINPMGVHTGDSVTVVPTFTLRDSEFQNMRDAAKKIFRALNMRIGGANIQFALHPLTGEMVVVEMNPRVSRSSALVSKATGYPIAHIATRLALGASLDVLINEITQKSSGAYEPVIDYVAIKIPRFDFEKLAPNMGILGIAMKSVGEVLGFGSSFQEAMTKAWQSLERGFDCLPTFEEWLAAHPQCGHLSSCEQGNIATFPLIKSRILAGHSLADIHSSTGVGLFFLNELKELFDAENDFGTNPQSLELLVAAAYPPSWFAKREGTDENSLFPNSSFPERSFRLIDSCAGEFEAKTPYYFSSNSMCANENRIEENSRRVVILGSGPNRIGQGIEFDYACVHAVQTLKKQGVQAIMVNCNPETVSTDYLEADKLYIEPIDSQSISAILQTEKPMGVLLQFGGQSPLKLAHEISAMGIPILGSSLETIELCENRKGFEDLLRKLGLQSPASRSFGSMEELKAGSSLLGFPVLLRPSYVIGGQGMSVVYNQSQLLGAVNRLGAFSPENPVIMQVFLEGGTEYDVDLLCDGRTTQVAGILRHLDPPGIHSGDSICEWLPPQEYPQELLTVCNKIALATGSVGLVNIQCVMLGKEIFVLEANPRCSRTVPFLAKVKACFPAVPEDMGMGIIECATRLCLGESLGNAQPAAVTKNKHYAFKFPVFPYSKFENLERGPGPEMHSLGEVMGHGSERLAAFVKGALSAGWKFPGGDSTPLKIWVDTPASLRELSPLIGELEFLCQSQGFSLDTCLGTDGNDPLQCDVILAPRYFRFSNQENEAGTGKQVVNFSGKIAQAIGASKPVAMGPETAGLILTALCLLFSQKISLGIQPLFAPPPMGAPL